MEKKIKLKIWFDKLFNRTIKVTNIEELKYYLSDAEGKLEKLNNSFNTQEGYVNVAKDNIEECKIKMKNIIKSRDKLISIGLENLNTEEKHLLDGLNTTFNDLEADLKGYKDDLDLSTKLRDNMDSQRKVARKNIDNMRRKIRNLERKSDYSERIDEYNKVMKNTTGKEIKDISDEVNVKYYAAESKLKDINDSVKLENYISSTVSDNGGTIDDFLKITEDDIK